MAKNVCSGNECKYFDSESYRDVMSGNNIAYCKYSHQPLEIDFENKLVYCCDNCIQNDDNEIKNCPFCGSKAYTDKVGKPLFTIRCSNVKCYAAINKNSFDECVKAWNKRM